MYKVVLVDDEEWSLIGLKSLSSWEDHGFEIVFSTTDPVLAWEKIQKQMIDVVFCDIRMPEIDGFAMLDRIRENGLKCVFVIISGYAEFQYAQEAISKGVYDYLLKPVNNVKLGELLERLRETLDRNQFSDNSELLDDPARLLKKIKESNCFDMLSIMRIAAVHVGKLTDEKNVKQILKQRTDNVLVLWESSRDILLVSGEPGNRKKEFSELGRLLVKEGCYVGLSRPFYLKEGIEYAVSEAKDSSAGWFFGKEATLEVFQSSSRDYFRVYSAKVRMAVAGRQINKIHELLGEIYNDNRSGKLGMDSVEFLMEDIRNTLMRKYGLMLPQKNDMESITKILKRFPDGKTFFNVLEKNVTRQLLRVEEGTAVPKNEQFKKLLEYVDLHYAEPLQLKTLAEMYYMNMSYCSELFKKVTGKTFSAYLMALRMEMAMELLQSGTETVSAVAEKVGFSDSYYFCKVFKKYFGVSPNTV